MPSVKKHISSEKVTHILIQKSKKSMDNLSVQWQGSGLKAL